MGSTIFFIDHLTVFSWLKSIWPVLFWNRLNRRQVSRRCYYVDGSIISISLARLTAVLLGLKLSKLAFKLTSVSEQKGTLSHLLVAYEGLNEARKEVANQTFFHALQGNNCLPGRLADFLLKTAVNGEPGVRGTIAQTQYMAHVCAWKNRVSEMPVENIVLFQESYPWFEVAQKYAAANGVALVQTRAPFAVKKELIKRLPHWMVVRLQRARHRQNAGIPSSQPDSGSSQSPTRAPLPDRQSLSLTEPGPRLLVESNGMLNVNRPDLHSDLFFWQTSPLQGRDLLLTFAIPQVPLNQQLWDELQHHDMSAVVLHPGASKVPSSSAPIFSAPHPSRLSIKPVIQIKSHRAEKKWLRESVATYSTIRDYWAKLCLENNIKVMTTQDKYDATHCAIADGLKANGGVMTLYQRAFESDPSAITTVTADVIFGFSSFTADIERRSGSTAQYHVTTGYLGDHRFPLVRDSARRIRETLQSNGARHIMAFFDENSREDARWHSSHLDMSENYKFLIQKVLDEPWFGLVIKPKLARHLRARLGPVDELLELAEATGRCYVFDDNGFRGLHPPAAAALAADIAVHSHISAATAGVESALAGVPTLLLDTEGWTRSPFYRLGLGKTVFTSWSDIWSACLEQWSNAGMDSKLGDWSIMLEGLDPFRDGRASERMGTYLNWLLDSFKNGKDREVAMADAAQRYGELWGYDKVTDINWGTAESGDSLANIGFTGTTIHSLAIGLDNRSHTT